MKLVNSIKQFFKKHVSVLIVLVALLVAGVNYLIFPTFITKELQLVDVPIANETIKSSSRITENMLTTLSINKSLLPDNVIFDEKDIIGKYVQNDYAISKNGFFYKESLTTEETIMGKTYHQLNPQETAYVLKIDSKYNLDNTLKVGEFIDLYYYTTIKDLDDVERIVVGKLKDLARIVSVGEGNNEDVLSIAITEDEVEYFVLAENTGKILPLVVNDPSCLYFDVNMTRSFLLESGFVFTQTYGQESEE